VLGSSNDSFQGQHDCNLRLRISKFQYCAGTYLIISFVKLRAYLILDFPTTFTICIVYFEIFVITFYSKL